MALMGVAAFKAHAPSRGRGWTVRWRQKGHSETGVTVKNGATVGREDLVETEGVQRDSGGSERVRVQRD